MWAWNEGGNKSVKCSGGNSWQGRHCGGKPTPFLQRQHVSAWEQERVSAVLFTVRPYTTWEQHPSLNRLTNNTIISFLAISVFLLSRVGKTSQPYDCNMTNEFGRLISTKGIGDKVNFHFIITLDSTANPSQKYPGRAFILIQFPGWLYKPWIINPEGCIWKAEQFSKFLTVSDCPTKHWNVIIFLDRSQWNMTSGAVLWVITGMKPWEHQKAISCVWQKAVTQETDMSLAHLPVHLQNSQWVWSFPINSKKSENVL